MDDEIPSIVLLDLSDEGESKKNLESEYNDVVAASESSHKYGSYYKSCADDLNKQILWWGAMLAVVFLAILFSPCLSNVFFKKSVHVLRKEAHILNVNEIGRPGSIIAVYYLSKASVFGFLVALFVQVGRIFNQLRRLEITYRDKYIMAETYGKFIQNNRDEGSHTIIREHAHKAMFSLTLEQAEKNLEKRFAFDARTSKVILKIIKALKVK